MYDATLIERIRQVVGVHMGKRDATYTFRLPGGLKSMVDNVSDDTRRDLHDSFIALIIAAVDRESMPDRIRAYLE